MTMFECDRCNKEYSTKLMAKPRYVVKERFYMPYQDVEDPLYLCPECTRVLEKFMSMEVEPDDGDG